ncbi:MAG: HAD-IIA family hydrolase [Halanaerobiales bacterium]
MIDIQNIECFLLDMDGTIYLGNDLIDGAIEFLERLKETGREFYFFTNNSSKSPTDYYKKLLALGIEIAQERIITSGQVTINYIIKQQKDPLVYLVGTPSLEEQFIERGLRLTDDKLDEVDFLVLGFDTTLNYKKLWDAHDLILKGVKYIATNPDYVCPLAGGKSMPDCGAMISLLKTSTGREPLVIGKPNTLMIDFVQEKTGLARDKIAMIGDRLYTDIQTAINAGITSMLVLSGESTRADLEKAEQDPDYVFNSVKEIKTFL